MNYFPFHVGDYVSATRHLSWEEDAAYRRLLDTYYTTEKPLPTDLRAVCRLVLAQTDSQREAVRQVLEEFFELTEEGWRNRRADAEIEAMREKQEKQRAKAQARWNKQRTEHGNAPAIPRHDEPDATASEIDADAMPPTPTPTPTPKEEIQKPHSSPSGPSPGYRPPPCPYSELVSLYHSKLPTLPRVEVLSDGRRRSMQARWRDVCADGKCDTATALEWFGWYFDRVASSDFLLGRVPGKSGRTWKADFDFLFNPSKFAKVIEGSYVEERT